MNVTRLNYPPYLEWQAIFAGPSAGRFPLFEEVERQFFQAGTPLTWFSQGVVLAGSNFPNGSPFLNFKAGGRLTLNLDSSFSSL